MAGLDLTSPAWSLAQASDPTWAIHARVIFYACMNSAKVIKLPSHCSSSCFQYRNRTKGRKNRVIAALISLRFLFVFLHTIMHHYYCRDWEGKRTYLVLERWRQWWCCVLRRAVSPSFFLLLFCSSLRSALLHVSLSHCIISPLLFLTLSPLYFLCSHLSRLCSPSPPLFSSLPLFFPLFSLLLLLL